MPHSDNGSDRTDEGEGEFGRTVECPHCESVDTERQALFGTIQASSSYYCNGCNSVFEWVKLERNHE